MNMYLLSDYVSHFSEGVTDKKTLSMLAQEFPNLFILVLFWPSKESAAGMEILYV